VKSAINPHVRSFARLLRSSGPYLLLELLMPGGTLLALLLFYYERRNGFSSTDPLPRRAARVIGSAYQDLALAVDTDGIATTWRGLDGARDGLEALAMVPAR
jgi:hypothetical protein